MHTTSHLNLYEEENYSELLQLRALIEGEPDRPLSAADVRPTLARLAAVGTTPACILCEVPQRELGCAALPWEELVALRDIANEFNCPLHMDGARLHEIAPYYGKTPKEVADLFDSVYISFYKGLGGMTGAMLLGDEAFIEQATVWRRRLGGTPYTVLPYAVSCCAAYRKHRGTFAERYRKLARVAKRLRGCGSVASRLRFVPEEPTCCQALCYLRGSMSALDAARDAVESALGYRVYERLREAPGGGGECLFEWTLGPSHVGLPEETWEQAWVAFFEALEEAEQANRGSE